MPAEVFFAEICLVYNTYHLNSWVIVSDYIKMTGNFCMFTWFMNVIDMQWLCYVNRWIFIHNNVHKLILRGFKEALYLTRLRWIGDHLILDVSIFFKSGVNWVMSSNLKPTQGQKMSHLVENREFLCCYVNVWVVIFL